MKKSTQVRLVSIGLGVQLIVAIGLISVGFFDMLKIQFFFNMVMSGCKDAVLDTSGHLNTILLYFKWLGGLSLASFLTLIYCFRKEPSAE